MGDEGRQQTTLAGYGLLHKHIIYIMYALLLVPHNLYYFQKIDPWHAKFAIFFTYLIIFIATTFSFTIVKHFFLTNIFNS